MGAVSVRTTVRPSGASASTKSRRRPKTPDDDSVEPQSEPRHSEAARAHRGFRDQSFRVIGCGSIHVIC